jgi:hypothetical protein
MNLFKLPQEMILYITSYLNFRDHRNFSRTCKYLYQIDERKNINLSELKRNIYYLFGFNFCRNLCLDRMEEIIPGLKISFFAQNELDLEDESYLMIELYDRFYDPRNIHYQKDSDLLLSNLKKTLLSIGYKWVGADMFNDFYSITMDSHYNLNFSIFLDELFDKVYHLLQTFQITNLYSMSIFDLLNKIRQNKVYISNYISGTSNPIYISIQKEFDKIHVEKQKELSEKIYKSINYFELEEIEKYIIK